MTTDNRFNDISEPAGADLSSSQFKVVQMDTSGKIIDMTAITEFPIGILQNEPDAADKPAHITPMNSGGLSKIRLGATLTPGVLVGSGTDGRAVADATTNFTLGLLTKGGDADDIGTVLLGSYTAKA